MSYEIRTTPRFEKSAKSLAKRHRSLKSDLLELISQLEENPFRGDELCPGIYKLRMAITSKGRGKSGGARVITCTLFADNHRGNVYLIDIYDKADYSTVDVAMLKKVVADLGVME